MVFLFKEGGGFNTEDGLPKVESGDLSHVSKIRKLGDCFLIDSGVLISGDAGQGGSIWTDGLTGGSGWSSLIDSLGSSSVTSFLHCILGNVSLLRMDDEDLVFE